MRIEHRYLCFEKNPFLLESLDRLAIRYKERQRSYDENTHLYVLEFFLYEDNPRFSEMQAELEVFGMEPQIGTVFEKNDIEKANWFHIVAGEYQYPQPENGYLQATFNLDDYCPNCGIGKSQHAPFRLKTKPKQLNNQFWGLHWVFDAIFVRAEARNILEKENVTGISFSKPVLHKNGEVVEELWQINIESELEQGIDDYNLSREVCGDVVHEPPEWAPPARLIHYCERLKYHFPQRGGITFKGSSFQNMPDFVRSHEWFGSGGAAMQLLIVSKRIKQIVEKNKLKGLKFTPIVHERLC